MKRLSTFVLAIIASTILLAQSPQKMSYQAVIRDASNQLVTSHTVGMKISILQGSTTGTVVYTETQTPTTNANGLISLEFGGGTGFSSIDWSTGSYFIQTETDPTGGTNYTITGTSQLLSVPFALYAQKADEVKLTSTQIAILKGDKGDQGLAGKDGSNGLSAYQIWLQAGNKGDTNTFLSSLKGIQGDPGIAIDDTQSFTTKTYSSNNIEQKLKSKVDTSSFTTLTKKYNALLSYIVATSTNFAALKNSGFTALELISAGATIANLKSAGFTASDLITIGYSLTDLKNAGYTAIDLYAIGYTVTDLTNAGFTLQQLVLVPSISTAQLATLFNLHGQTGTGITDVDGNSYSWIGIGNQIWLQQNLATTRYNDGSIIPNVTDSSAWTTLTSPAYCWYNNEISNKPTYGALYNWYTINTGKLSPIGWHIPFDNEWEIMQDYLMWHNYNYDGNYTTADNKIAKSLATSSGWSSSSLTGVVGNTDYPTKQNASGFSALPAGFRNQGFCGGESITGWWRTQEATTVTGTSTNAYCFYLAFDYISLHGVVEQKVTGFSVRVIRD